MYKLTNKCTNLQTNVQTYKFFKCTNVQTYKCTNLNEHRRTSKTASATTTTAFLQQHHSANTLQDILSNAQRQKMMQTITTNIPLHQQHSPNLDGLKRSARQVTEALFFQRIKIPSSLLSCVLFDLWTS